MNALECIALQCGNGSFRHTNVEYAGKEAEVLTTSDVVQPVDVIAPLDFTQSKPNYYKMPTDMPKVKQTSMSRELSEPIPESKPFEGLPGVRSVAGDLKDQWVQTVRLQEGQANSYLQTSKGQSHYRHRRKLGHRYRPRIRPPVRAPRRPRNLSL